MANSTPSVATVSTRNDVYLSIYDATWSGYGGVLIWGGIYGCIWTPIVVLLVYIPVFNSLSIEAVITSFFGFVLMFFVAGLVGMLFAGCVGILVMVVVCLFNRMMDHIWSPITAVSIVGGLTGFLCTCIAPIAAIDDGNVALAVISYLVGPIAAMAFGQFGGVRMTARQIKVHYQRHDTKVEKFWSPDPKSDLRQFDLKQMLIVTGWLGAVFASLSAIGRFSPSTSIVLASYFLIQWVVYFPVQMISSRYVLRNLDKVKVS